MLKADCEARMRQIQHQILYSEYSKSKKPFKGLFCVGILDLGAITLVVRNGEDLGSTLEFIYTVKIR